MTTWKDQIAQLFALHRKKVEQMVFRKVRDREAAADIVQTVFTRFLSKESTKTEDEHLKMLFVAARNEAFNYRSGRIRRNSILGRLTPEQISVPTTSSHDNVEGKQAMQALEMALSILPSRTREIFVRRRLRGETNAEIASDMKISTRAVEKHLVKAMEHCRAALDEFLSL